MFGREITTYTVYIYGSGQPYSFALIAQLYHHSSIA